MTVAKNKKSEEPKKTEITELYLVRKGLEVAEKYSEPQRFRYAIMRNMDRVMVEINRIEKPLKDPNPDMVAYRKERQKLVEKLASRNGDEIKRQIPTQAQQRASLPGDIIYKDPEKAEAELMKLKNKNQKHIDKQNELEEDINEYIDTDFITDWKWYKVEMSEVPDGMNAEIMRILKPILIDDLEEEYKNKYPKRILEVHEFNAIIMGVNLRKLEKEIALIENDQRNLDVMSKFKDNDTLTIDGAGSS